MKRLIRNICCILLMLSLLPLLSGCDNEDDVVGIFTGKTWKLSRLTNKGSNAQFYPNLWNNNEEEMKKSLDKLYNQKSTFTLNFEGTELDGELMGTTVNGQGINSSVNGTWKADGASLAQHQRKGYGVRRERCTGQDIHLRTAKCVQV